MMTRSGNLLLLAKVALNKPKPICSEVSVQTDPVKFSSAEDADVTSGQPGKPILLDRSGNCGHDYVRPNETDVTDVPKNSGTSLVDSSCQADLSETLDGESASLDALNPPISNILEEIVQDFDPDQWADLFNQQDNLDEILQGVPPTDSGSVEEIVDSIKSYEGNLTSKVEKSRPQPELIVISESVCERDVKPVLYKLDPMVVEEADMEDEDNLVFEMSYSQAEEVVRSRIILDAHQNSCMWEMCGIQCDSPADLFEHIKEIHVDPSPPVSVGGGFYCCINNCPVPDRKFTKRFWLLDHIRRRHIPVGLFQCSECDKSFCTKELVRRHLKSHKSLEVRDYRCRLCPKTFRHSTDLSRHKKTHKDKRPFKCKFPGCGKDYTDHSGLRKHLSLHHPNEKSSKHNNINNNNSVNQSYSAGASVPIDDFDDPMIYLEADSHANVSPITFTYAAEPSTSRTDVSSNVSPIAAVAAAGPVKSSVQSNNNATSSSSNSGKLNKDMILRLFNIPTLIVETANTEEKKVFWLKKAD